MLFEKSDRLIVICHNIRASASLGFFFLCQRKENERVKPNYEMELFVLVNVPMEHGSSSREVSELRDRARLSRVPVTRVRNMSDDDDAVNAFSMRVI